MKEAMKALYAFWASFGLPAYPENAVPDDAQLPYITYTVSIPGWEYPGLHQARVWYRDTSYEAVNAKVEEILERIGGGAFLETSRGALLMRTGDPVVQFQPMEGTEMKVAYLNFELKNYMVGIG